VEGFAEKGTPEGWDLALGTVRGFRVWTLNLPLKSASEILRQPWRRDITGWGQQSSAVNAFILPDIAHSSVEGMFGGRWKKPIHIAWDGWLDATCGNMIHDQPPQTGQGCGCGFWAYWNARDNTYFQSHDPWVKQQGEGYSLRIQLMGVIEGSGPTIIGERGFRTARARVTDLSMPGIDKSCIYEGEDFELLQAITDPDLRFFSAARKTIEPPLPRFLSSLGIPEDQVKETLCEAVESHLGTGLKWHPSAQQLIDACPPDENYGG
jgi:hypothetical protein